MLCGYNRRHFAFCLASSARNWIYAVDVGRSHCDLGNFSIGTRSYCRHTGIRITNPLLVLLFITYTPDYHDRIAEPPLEADYAVYFSLVTAVHAPIQDES